MASTNISIVKIVYVLRLKKDKSKTEKKGYFFHAIKGSSSRGWWMEDILEATYYDKPPVFNRMQEIQLGISAEEYEVLELEVSFNSLPAGDKS